MSERLKQARARADRELLTLDFKGREDKRKVLDEVVDAAIEHGRQLEHQATVDRFAARGHVPDSVLFEPE